LYFLAQGAGDADASLVELLIGAGADVNRKDREGGSPLHHMTIHAYGCKALAVTQVLIKAGADVNIKNKYGKTPLDSA